MKAFMALTGENKEPVAPLKRHHLSLPQLGSTIWPVSQIILGLISVCLKSCASSPVVVM
jgi:hypothetical protein